MSSFELQVCEFIGCENAAVVSLTRPLGPEETYCDEHSYDVNELMCINCLSGVGPFFYNFDDHEDYCLLCKEVYLEEEDNDNDDMLMTSVMDLL